MSAIDFCVSMSGGEQVMDAGLVSHFIDGGKMNSSEEVSVTVSATVHLISQLKKLPSGTTAAYGTVDVGDWANLKDASQSPKSIKVTFVIPSGLTEMDSRNSCIILTVPSSFLPLSKRSSACVPSFLNKEVTCVGSLSAINPNGTDPVCKAGAFLKLSYNRKSEQDFYLSELEKWNVYLRLVHASYFLFAVAVALMCFSLLKTKTYTTVVTIDKIPLGL